MSDFKIVFIGDGGVGKTILCKNLLGMNFEPRYVPTLGAEVHPVEHSDSVIWDCPGQERYGGLGDGYYFLEHLVPSLIVVFHNPQGKDMNNWRRRDFSRVGVVPGNQYIHVMSKSDLLTKEQKEMFEKKGMLLVSGKTGEGVQEFLQTLYIETSTRRRPFDLEKPMDDYDFDICHPKPKYMIGDWVKHKPSNMKFQVHDIFVRRIDPFRYRYSIERIASHLYEEDLVLIRPRDETVV